MRKSPLFASLLSAGLLSMVTAMPPAALAAQPAAPRAHRHRSGVSIDYAARAAKSHAGKPAGYVKAY